MDGPDPRPAGAAPRGDRAHAGISAGSRRSRSEGRGWTGRGRVGLPQGRDRHGDKPWRQAEAAAGAPGRTRPSSACGCGRGRRAWSRRHRGHHQGRRASMTIPTSTYRLQFRNGMTFDRAAGLVPYLQRLGISHLYASPIFSATSGSTHGYDVTDANEFDPVLGGRDGFLRLSDALREHGLGLILDIVPNHMATSLEKPWWYH